MCPARRILEPVPFRRWPRFARWQRAIPLASSLLLLLVLLVPARASAQSEAEKTAAARALALEGVALAEAGDCNGAIDRFSRAEQLFHAPTILLGLGECQCKVGRLVEGTENLNRVARENLGPNPPKAFSDAQEKARQLHAAYLPKVGKLTLKVQSPSDAPFVLSVDGAEVPAALVGVARPIDPGTHEVRAEGQAYQPATQTVTVGEGQAQELTLVLELLPEAAPVAPPPPVDTPPPPPPPAPEPNLVPAYIAFGVGAVGIGVGSYFGLSAMSAQSDLDETCRDRACPESASGEIDSMQSDATIATVGFGVGLVGIAAGAYLWLTAEPGGTSGSGSTPRPEGIAVRAFLGPTSAAIAGEF